MEPLPLAEIAAALDRSTPVGRYLRASSPDAALAYFKRNDETQIDFWFPGVEIEVLLWDPDALKADITVNAHRMGLGHLAELAELLVSLRAMLAGWVDRKVT